MEGLVRAKRPRALPVVLTREEVHRGKGAKDRVTMITETMRRPLLEHLERVRVRHQADRACGAGWVQMPDALDRKLPGAGREWAWQWVYPATRTYLDRATRRRIRHHFHESAVLGHTNVATTMIYTHVLNKGGLGVRSLADRLDIDLR